MGVKKAGRKNRKRGTHRRFGMSMVFLVLAVSGLIWWVVKVPLAEMGKESRKEKEQTPEDFLVTYMDHICRKEYDAMYEMIQAEDSDNISKEDFVERNRAIYEGIEVTNLMITDVKYEEAAQAVQYETSFDTVAGTISFRNIARILKEEDGFALVWNNGLIFPDLEASDKVRVVTLQPQRGQILDRNGAVLAGEGLASSVGIVPGKWENQEAALTEVASLLDVSTETIEKKLSASWVKEDSFVPIKTLPKVQEIDLLTMEPDADILQEKTRQDSLLQIPGVMISDITVRSYPLGEAAAHLVGYVQNVTAEDLEEHKGEGYTANSVIGRSGMEGLFEDELRGTVGRKIYIEDENGNEKEMLAYIAVADGKDVKLTIDSGLQSALYRQFQEDKGCSVAMNPYTGEVLALISTPSYDTNDFIRGLSEAQWTSLNEDERNPLYNRFRQTWCPGSTFKPVIAAIGLQSGAIDPNEDYGSEGLSWQKDASWGSYYVTTLHDYEPVILENALIYSDNIYFAKVALKIGTDFLENSLSRLGFGEALPFEIQMAKSQYSNTEHIETEIQLADSGYGQGQILINPLHLACLYTAFCNEGNVIRPYLVSQPQAEAAYWLPKALSAEVADQVLEGMKKVVNDPNGTGHGAYRDNILLAGKTGTAETKTSKEDTSGTEFGWFAVFTPQPDQERPILLVSMVEDVKTRGGSGYVVEKDNQVLEEWFRGLGG